MNMQETQGFLDGLVDQQEVAIYLVNGIKLTGTILKFDDVGVVMTTGNNEGEQLVMRTAISSVVPSSASVSHGKNQNRR